MDVRCTAVVELSRRETGTRRTACVVAVLVKQAFYKAKDADQLVASQSTSTVPRLTSLITAVVTGENQQLLTVFLHPTYSVVSVL